MSNPELLAQLRQLSCVQKFQMMQFLMTKLAKKEMLKPLDNGAGYRVWSPYDYGDAAQKLMSLLEQEETEKAVVGQISDFPHVRLARASDKIESVITED